MPSQREIVLIPVPYSDLSIIKNRPMLILSSDSLLKRSPDMPVASITSNIAAGMVGIIFDVSDMERGTLPRKSLIRADKIYTLSQREILKSYGLLKQSVFEDVLSELDAALGR